MTVFSLVVEHPKRRDKEQQQGNKATRQQGNIRGLYCVGSFQTCKKMVLPKPQDEVAQQPEQQGEESSSGTFQQKKEEHEEEEEEEAVDDVEHEEHDEEKDDDSDYDYEYEDEEDYELSSMDLMEELRRERHQRQLAK